MPALDSLHMRQLLADDLGGDFYRRFLRAWYERADEANLGMVSSYPSTGAATVSDYPTSRFTATSTPDGSFTPKTAAEQGLIPDNPDEFRKRLAHTLMMAHNFYVTPEMEVLVSAAAEKMPDDEPVREDDFPVPHGWFWIPGGITEIDARGSVIPTSAILWNLSGGVVELTYFVDKLHPLDNLPGNDRENSQMPRLTPWSVLRMGIGKPIVRSLSLGVVVPPEVASEITIHTTEGVGPNGRPSKETSFFFPKGFDASDLTPSIRPDQVAVWLLSCLRLMQQYVTVVTDQGVPAGLRRSLRGKVRLRNMHVTVIQYRRRMHGQADSETGRSFTHRHLRRGHWRQQPYKNEGEWERKRIWIHPTIVGDPSLPLLLRDHVNALTR